MKTYKIPVTWEAYGTVRIEAESLEEAIELAKGDDIPLPDGCYVDGSWEVDEEMAEFLEDEASEIEA